MLLALGLKETGGNYNNIKVRCKEFEIDTSHFFSRGWHQHGHPDFKEKYSLDDYFVKGIKKKPSSQVKDRLLNNGLKKYECEQCGLSDWNNKRIILELHHINANSLDNRLENLKLLCPNCHSQTHNYCKRKELLDKESALSEKREVEYRKFRESLTANPEPSLFIEEGAETKKKKEL